MFPQRGIAMMTTFQMEVIFFNNHIKGEYGVLKSFANKMLAEVTPIDEEIQEVINNHFWDMI